MIFDWGERLWLIVAGLGVIAFAVYITLALIEYRSQKPSKDKRTAQFIYFGFIIALVSVAVLTTTFGAAKHHRDTVHARRDLIAQGFHVLSVTTSQHVATVAVGGCSQEFVLKHPRGFFIIGVEDGTSLRLLTPTKVKDMLTTAGCSP